MQSIHHIYRMNVKLVPAGNVKLVPVQPIVQMNSVRAPLAMPTRHQSVPPKLIPYVQTNKHWQHALLIIHTVHSSPRVYVPTIYV